MTSTIYAIGDVHGRADLLGSLIAFIGEHSRIGGAEPRVFFLGDIVDRGPDSREAMEIVCKTLKRWPQSRLLIGNHDFIFLDAMTNQFWVQKWFEKLGGMQTLISYLGEGTHYTADEIIGIGTRFPELLEVLKSAPQFLTVGRYLFVHAGINPSIPLADQTRNDLLQIRDKFTDHVGPLSHVVVHGHTPQDPSQPVVTENRISRHECLGDRCSFDGIHRHRHGSCRILCHFLERECQLDRPDTTRSWPRHRTGRKGLTLRAGNASHCLANI